MRPPSQPERRPAGLVPGRLAPLHSHATGSRGDDGGKPQNPSATGALIRLRPGAPKRSCRQVGARRSSRPRATGDSRRPLRPFGAALTPYELRTGRRSGRCRRPHLAPAQHAGPRLSIRSRTETRHRLTSGDVAEGLIFRVPETLAAVLGVSKGPGLRSGKPRPNCSRQTACSSTSNPIPRAA
jgi:hypothetical protein